MKQLKPRDKITQKMTRDGAVEINETQQTAERISSREADSDFSQPDTATAERVMEHLDAAHTRKASKKAVKKAQEAAVLRTSTSRLQFTDEERETPKLQPSIKKSEKAADKLDAAKAALPKQKKLVKERTFEETTGKAKTRLRFEEQEKPIPGGKAHSNPLSHPAQEAAFLSFVQHDKVYQKYYDEIIILLGTGLRISELCGLTEADIDLDKQLINVDHQLLKIADVGYYVETPKTKSGNRVIPMSEKVLEAFQRVLNKRKYAQPIILEGYTKFLFLNRNGLPKVAVNYESMFRGLVRKYNKTQKVALPKVMTPHTLRHTFCTTLANAGMNPKALQYIMGHSNINMTLNYYAHTTSETSITEMKRLIA